MYLIKFCNQQQGVIYVIRVTSNRLSCECKCVYQSHIERNNVIFHYYYFLFFWTSISSKEWLCCIPASDVYLFSFVDDNSIAVVTITALRYGDGNCFNQLHHRQQPEKYAIKMVDTVFIIPCLLLMVLLLMLYISYLYFQIGHNIPCTI